MVDGDDEDGDNGDYIVDIDDDDADVDSYVVDNDDGDDDDCSGEQRYIALGRTENKKRERGVKSHRVGWNFLN